VACKSPGKRKESGKGPTSPTPKKETKMKKLMIAATLLASTVAMADLCDEVLGPAGNGCALYDVQFKFKTLAGKDARCTAAQLEAVAQQAWAAQYLVNGKLPGIAYLDNATRTFNGILWQCAAACFEGDHPGVAQGAQNAGAINYVLWDKKAARLVSPAAKYTAPANGQPASWVGGDPANNEQNRFDILGRYGKNATKVAAFWKPTMNADFPGEEIYAAGFGTWNTKLSVIKTVSGNAVAKLIPVVVTTAGDTCNDGSAMPSVLAYMCNDFKGWCCGTCVAYALAPASGTWSIKYNASKSKNGQLSKILPWDANGLQTYTRQ